MSSTRRNVLATLALALTAGGVAAQAPFPSRPIKIVVPYGPGASADIMARLIGQKVSEDLKQPVIIENRAGAGGMVGSDHVAKSAPDGYTILLANDGTHTGNPFMIKNHPFDPIKDVTPITMAARNIIVLVAHPGLPVNNVAELIRHAKANPGKLSFGSSGNGSPHHLAGVLFNASAGVDILHVAYKGGGPAVVDVMGGQIPLAYSSLASVAPQIKAGKLKALGVTEKTRYAALPEVPAIAETLPGFEMPSWHGFVGPAGMPQPIVKTLNESLARALNAPDVRRKLAESGLLVVANSPEEFGAELKAHNQARGLLIKQHNIQSE
jgi:tripartite-type tricarboxylate transporter receptor subunit TctC